MVVAGARDRSTLRAAPLYPLVSAGVSAAAQDQAQDNQAQHERPQLHPVSTPRPSMGNAFVVGGTGAKPGALNVASFFAPPGPVPISVICCHAPDGSAAPVSRAHQAADVP